VQWTDACGSELVEIREFEPRYLKILFFVLALIKGRTFLFVQLYNFRGLVYLILSSRLGGT
jgi:hypothetical protein